MIISVAAGFAVGFLCLFLKSMLMGTDGEGVWKVVDAIFFRDITATKSIEGIGLFYIIGTAAGIDITPMTLILTAFLSICTAVGTPAIPVAGTTMVYVVMMGLGFNSELCMIGYSLVLAMNYLPGMAVITLNVVGDAATNVIVSHKEGALNKEIYNKK